MKTEARRAARLPIAQAYAACERLAREHYENFPVASRLLPSSMRPHVAALYAFARSADDFADEGSREPAERVRLLDDWLMRLRASASNVAPDTDHVPVESAELIFLALGHTIRTCSLPLSLFEDLLSAFRQDVTCRRYATWAEVLDYCRRSANPVGRLVLRIAGYNDSVLDAASDSLCTALQLTNFWQDLATDFERGRLYLPASDRDGCGASETDLASRLLTPPWRCALDRAAARTRELFEQGRLVCETVGGRLGFELRLTWHGGMRILERLERAGFNVFQKRPQLGASDAAVIAARTLRWSVRVRRLARQRALSMRTGSEP